MLFAKLAVSLAALPLLVSGQPTIAVAQSSDAYANWIYLYEDTFDNSAGQAITQQWWLEPNPTRQHNLLNFTLLARRSPASNNGTAAAVFDYVADCDTRAYTMEQAEFLDANDATLDVQTYQRVMESADPEDEFYSVLGDLCSGAY